MAKGNLPACLAFTLKREGGFTANRKDPGNWTGGKVGVGELKGTQKGISAAAFPNLDIKNLTDGQIAGIYEARYWRPVRGDDLPMGVDLPVFDYAVNSGPGRSAKDTQRVVGAPVDGEIGPVTLAAVQRFPARDFIKKLCGRRLGFYQSLAIWNTFGRGWARRIAAVEATALSWVSSKPQLEQDAKDARGKAAGQAGGAVATGGGGVAAPDVTGFPWWLILLIVAAVAAPLIIRAVINAQRASALSKAAKEA